MGATRKDILREIVLLTLFHPSKDRVTVIRGGKIKGATTGDSRALSWVRDTRGAQRIHRGRVSL